MERHDPEPRPTQVRLVALALLVVAVLPVTPAGALSCARPPEHPSSAELAIAGDFQGRFDGAVVGVVEREGSGTSGRPVYVVSVEQSYGQPVGEHVEIIGDGTWWRLKVGERYFVPYVGDDRARRLLLCRDVPQRLPPLPTRERSAPMATDPSSGRSWDWYAGAALLTAGAGVAVIVVLRRRRAARWRQLTPYGLDV